MRNYVMLLITAYLVCFYWYGYDTVKRNIEMKNTHCCKGNKLLEEKAKAINWKFDFSELFIRVADTYGIRDARPINT